MTRTNDATRLAHSPRISPTSSSASSSRRSLVAADTFASAPSAPRTAATASAARFSIAEATSDAISSSSSTPPSRSEDASLTNGWTTSSISVGVGTPVAALGAVGVPSSRSRISLATNTTSSNAARSSSDTNAERIDSQAAMPSSAAASIASMRSRKPSSSSAASISAAASSPAPDNAGCAPRSSNAPASNLDANPVTSSVDLLASLCKPPLPGVSSAGFSMASAAFDAAVSMASAAFLANPLNAPHKPPPAPGDAGSVSFDWPEASAVSAPVVFASAAFAWANRSFSGVRSSPAMCEPSSASSLPTPLAASMALAA